MKSALKFSLKLLVISGVLMKTNQHMIFPKRIASPKKLAFRASRLNGRLLPREIPRHKCANVAESQSLKAPLVGQSVE